MRQVLGVALGLILASTATAADKWQLQTEPGAVVRYQREQSSDQTLNIAGMDVRSTSRMFATYVQKTGERGDDGTLPVTETYEVLQAEMGVNGMSFEFDSARPDKEPDNPALAPFASLLRALFLTPVITVLEKDGTVREVQVPADRASTVAAPFSELFDPAVQKKAAIQRRNFLPDKPVSVGDKWERDIDSALGGGQTLSFRVQYEYAGADHQSGQVLEKITVKPLTASYALDATSTLPLKVSMSEFKVADGEGEILFDSKAGRIIKESSRFHVTGTLTFVAGDQKLPSTVDLTLSSNSALVP